MNSIASNCLKPKSVLLMICIAAAAMAGCSEKSAPQSVAQQNQTPQSPAPQSTPKQEAAIDTAGGCKNFPHEIFHMGARIEISDFAKLVETDCPKAKSFPDGRVEVTHLGSRYLVRSVRMEINGTEYYEIQSVKLIDRQSASDQKGQSR